MEKSWFRTNTRLPLLHSPLLASRPEVFAGSVIGYETFGRIEVILDVEKIAADHVRGSGNLRRDPRTLKLGGHCDKGSTEP